LDGKHVVFGSVVSGQDVLKRIEALETVADKPVKDVVIEDCGELLNDDTAAAAAAADVDATADAE
jgi:cellulose biosynthesis protein BcsQ